MNAISEPNQGIFENLPFVTVIIPAHNEEEHLAACLKSITKQDYPKDLIEIILVDNNSTDDTVNIARNFDIKILNQPSGNVGAVRNYGVSNSEGEILFFLDADCIAPNDWLKTGVMLIRSHPNSAFGGNALVRENPNWIEKYWLLDSPKASRNLIGATIALKRSHFESAGRFDESITSGEDSKLSQLLKDLGIKVLIEEELSVIHLGNPKSLTNFIRRQIWHSENYARNINHSAKDVILILTIAFLVSLLTSIGLAILGLDLWRDALAFSLFLPLFLSAKRIIRSREAIRNLKNLHKIYTLDAAYLIGRSLGLIKGIFQKNTWKSL